MMTYRGKLNIPAGLCCDYLPQGQRLRGAVMAMDAALPRPDGQAISEKEPTMDDDDTQTQLLTLLREKLEPDDYTTAEGLVMQMMTEGNGIVGMDSKRYTNMDKSTIREMQAIRTAETEVQPFVGAVMGMDSAAKVYRTALKSLGHDVAGVGDASMKSLFGHLKHTRGRASQAMDAAAQKSFLERFPNAARLRLR